jgi:hypothetical protein
MLSYRLRALTKRGAMKGYGPDIIQVENHFLRFILRMIRNRGTQNAFMRMEI